MSILERIWDLLGLLFGGTFERVGALATSVFGSANASIAVPVPTLSFWALVALSVALWLFVLKLKPATLRV